MYTITLQSENKAETASIMAMLCGAGYLPVVTNCGSLPEPGPAPQAQTAPSPGGGKRLGSPGDSIQWSSVPKVRAQQRERFRNLLAVMEPGREYHAEELLALTRKHTAWSTTTQVVILGIREGWLHRVRRGCYVMTEAGVDFATAPDGPAQALA